MQAQAQSLGNAVFSDPGAAHSRPKLSYEGGFGRNGRVLSVKGLYNIVPESYSAVFSLSQVGKDREAITERIDARIDTVRRKVAENSQAELHVDMISFNPVFEYKEEKKIFSENTYQEVPKGFKIRKNLHIRYEDPDFLQELIRTCSRVEIYDLVKVDHFAPSLEQKKWELMKEVRKAARKRAEFYQQLTKDDLVIQGTDFKDDMQVIEPKESYAQYQGYERSSSLDLVPEGQKQERKKKTTRYYKPESGKDFDIVKNPEILEPSIQISYGVQLYLRVPEKEEQEDQKTRRPEKEHHYHMVTPDGRVQELNIK